MIKTYIKEHIKNDDKGKSAASFAHILEIQKSQLKEWQSILKPEIYEKLEKHAFTSNATAYNAYDIFRGTDMNMFLYSLMTKD